MTTSDLERVLRGDAEREVERLNRVVEERERLAESARADRDRAARAVDVLTNFTGDQALAVFAHDSFCRENHADSCTWYYEILNDVHDWSGYAHRSWLGKIHNLTELAEAPSVTEVARAISICKVIIKS